jgi:hypothetical protein
MYGELQFVGIAILVEDQIRFFPSPSVFLLMK